MRDESGADVLLIGHSPQVQEMLTQLVRQCGGSAESFAVWEDCAESLRRRGCRLLVIDMNGDATSAVQAVIESRQVLAQTPILVLVERGDVPVAVRAIKAGATDCLEKSAEIEKRLCSTVEGILRQDTSPCPGSGALLTRTECLVLAHVLDGKTSREIADLLHRSPRTIEVHRNRIMHKVGASNVAHLVREATITGFSLIQMREA